MSEQAEQRFIELADAVKAYAAARPSAIGSRWAKWLVSRGWVEVDVCSGVRWKSPYNGTLYTKSVAMHLEREVIRWTMYDLAGWDEDANQRKARGEYPAPTPMETT